jgi:hypothetical protein
MKSKKFIRWAMTLGFLLWADFSHADLQWITGSVPKNATDNSNPAVVKDAPSQSVSLSSIGSQDIIVSHMITCTKIINDYPNDSVNYFYLNKNDQICYYFYFLIKPSSRIHTTTMECYNPSGIRIAKYDQEFRVSFVDRLLTIQNETYQWFLATMTLGMDHMRAEYGQTGLPKDVGLYAIRTSVDGELVGITFFYVKPQPTEPPSPSATAPPSPASDLNALPLNTPASTQPIPNNIP